MIDYGETGRRIVENIVAYVELALSFVGSSF